MDREEKILNYETFLNEKLRGDLKKILDQRDKVYQEISDYLQLKSVIERLQENETKEPLKTRVDLGCNFYVQAKVPDPTSIFVYVGYGFYVQFTFEQALKFIKQKTDLLTERTETLTKQSAVVKANIKLVLEGLREIHLIDDTPEKKQVDLFS